MVTSSASLLSGVCNIVSIKLDDNNYATWHFQMNSLLRGHGLLRFVDGTLPCPSQYTISEDGSLSPSEDYEAWLEQDSNLISLITATISSEALAQVVGCITAQEVWTALKDRYATISRSNVVQLKSNLQSIEKGSDNIEKYLLRVKSARDQLAAIGVKIADEDIMILILKGLPVEFSTVRFMIKAKSTPITMQELRSLLLAAESELEFESKSLSFAPLTALVAKNHASGSSGANLTQNSVSQTQDSRGLLPLPTSDTGYAAFHGSRSGPNRDYMPNSGGHGNPRPRNNWSGHNGGWNNNVGFGNSGYGNRGSNHTYGTTRHHSNNSNGGFVEHSVHTNSYSGRPRIFCQICGKPGHSAQTCWYLGKNSNNGATSSTIECQLCGNSGHSAVDCMQRQQFADIQTSHTAMTASLQHNSTAPPQEVWITDSGASSHMTADLSSMQNVTTYTDGDQVQIGNGAGLQIKHIGNGSIFLHKNALLTLKKILHVPKLAAHLLSVYQLCKDNNCRMIFDEFCFYI